MILGIDVGGTHTDSVLMKNRTIIRKSKVLTDKNNILNCVLQATHAVANPEDLKQLKRIVLSTTISTNAVAQNQLDPVGLIVMSGPGVSPKDLPLADKSFLVTGYMNHRGIEAESIDKAELEAFRKQHQVISTRLFTGRTVVHVLADANPGEGFTQINGGLEDVYFSTLTAARRAA